MLVLRNRLVSTPVMSLQTGSMIARTTDMIIDPRKLVIVAFYVDGPGIDVRPAVLHTSDIRETGPMGFIVDDADKLMSPEDLVRLQEVLDFKFKLDDKEVIDDTGRKVGRVANYTVDTDSFFVVKLHVRPGFWQAFGTTETLIDRTQIKSVSDKHIVVKAPTVKEREHAPAAQPAHNPFRGAPSHPQPEMIERQH